MRSSSDRLGPPHREPTRTFNNRRSPVGIRTAPGRCGIALLMAASDPELMRAAVVRSYGPVEAISIERIPTPVPGPGEVLVRVKVAGVGPWDALIRSGKSVVPHAPPITLGSDLSGTVESVGGGVTDLRPGDPVFGVTNPSFEGAYAEAAVAQASMLARRPTSISDLQGAAVPVIGVTAMQMLFERARLACGQRVLILGGAGNVGACAVQLARDAGARVTALVRANDVGVVRELGAEDAIPSLGAPPPGGAFEVVIDTVGGDSARSSVRWLAVRQRGVRSGPRLARSIRRPDGVPAGRGDAPEAGVDRRTDPPRKAGGEARRGAPTLRCREGAPDARGTAPTRAGKDPPSDLELNAESTTPALRSAPGVATRSRR